MAFPHYVVDVFTDRLFHGNPAAVCLPGRELSESLMAAIARENSLPETAFAVRDHEAWRLRWFTPQGEIDFCGHATMATAFVLARLSPAEGHRLSFESAAGPMKASVSGATITLDAPGGTLTEIPVTEAMARAVGVWPNAAFLDRDLLLVVDSEARVREMTPERHLLAALPGLCIAVTARGRVEDCVSRVFVPDMDDMEDPVTGSTHCMIIPYWARVLGKREIVAFQASRRSGVIAGEVAGGRVRLSGRAVLYVAGELFPDGPVPEVLEA